VSSNSRAEFDASIGVDLEYKSGSTRNPQKTFRQIVYKQCIFSSDVWATYVIKENRQNYDRLFRLAS